MPEHVPDAPGETDDVASLGSAVAMSVPAEASVESSREAEVREIRADGRDGKGRFAPGTTGNAGGRPKAKTTGTLTKELEGIVDRGELARVLWNLAQGKTKEGRKVARPNLSVQMAAVSYIYDRIDGKALQSLRHETDELPQFIIMHPGRMAPEELAAPETNGHATNGNGQSLLHQ